MSSNETLLRSLIRLGNRIANAPLIARQYHNITQTHTINILCYGHCIIVFKGFAHWTWFFRAHAVVSLSFLLFYTGCVFLIFLPCLNVIMFLYYYVCMILFLMPYYVYLFHICFCEFVTFYYVMLCSCTELCSCGLSRVR